MPEIMTMEQGSPEWAEARLGVPTASSFSKVLAKGQGKTRKTYMMTLLGERLTGQPAESFSNGHTERGHEMEAEARHFYSFVTDAPFQQVGFIRNGEVGCSPDGLVGDNGMVEIKTRLPHLQCELILADRVPPEHTAQIQGQLWVAEREWCDFVSYWPKLPLFVKRVERDEEYIANLAAEVERFVAELAELEERMKA